MAEQTIPQLPLRATMNLEYRVLGGKEVLHQQFVGSGKKEWRPIQTLDEGKTVKPKAKPKTKAKSEGKQDDKKKQG